MKHREVAPLLKGRSMSEASVSAEAAWSLQHDKAHRDSALASPHPLLPVSRD